MAARPRWFTLALTLPEIDEHWLAEFSAGLHADANQFGCRLIGGDTTKGPLNIGMQMLGLIDANRKPLCRSDARSGDLVVVTGTLGDAGAALQTEALASSIDNHFQCRYWQPSPRIDFAIAACDLIHAACDISDGLRADVGHIATQSQLDAVIHLAQLPVPSELLDNQAEQAQLNALTAGDDYELCLAVSPDKWTQLQAIAVQTNVQVSAVGRFERCYSQQSTVKVVDNNGREVQTVTDGYRHF